MRNHYLYAPVPVPSGPPRPSQGRTCPTCKRILIPTKAGTWPPHINTRRHDRTECKRSDQEVGE